MEDKGSLAWSLLAGTLAVLALTLNSLTVLALTPFLGPRRAYYACSHPLARVLLSLCRIRVELHGWEHLPEGIREGREPAIFMCNHESNMDGPALVAALPLPLVFISKKSLRWVPFLGWTAMAAGTIFIDRSNRDKAIESLNRAAIDIHNGKSVMIFPEGTRTRTGELGPLKKGGFALAENADVSVVPVAATGGFRILPAGSARLRAGTYVLRVGAPVHPRDYATRDDMLEDVRARMVSLLHVA